MDVENIANLVAEINTPLIQGNSRTSSAVNIVILDVDSKEKDLRLDNIAQSCRTYLTEQMDLIHDCNSESMTLDKEEENDTR